MRAVAGIRIRRALLATALASVAACSRPAAPQPPPNQPPPNLFLIVLDALRADRLGSYGSTVGLTPFLDQLAAEGTVFANAYAASTWTRPSIASLFTSRYPSQHHVVSFHSTLAKSEVTLAAVLHAAGYRTAAFVANPLIGPRGGFARGFDQYTVLKGGRSDPLAKVHADALIRSCLEWLDAQAPSPARRPLAIYLHAVDVHSPYQPAASRPERAAASPPEVVEEVNRRIRHGVGERDFHGDAGALDALADGDVALLADLYDGELAGLDAALRALFDALRERRLLEHAVVVITADHGEEFREHGGMTHGMTLYDEVTRVPLIIWRSDQPAHHLIATSVSLVDVAPTLLALAGHPAPAVFEGHSLADPLEQDAREASAGGRPFSDASMVLAELEPNGDEPIDLRQHAAAAIRGASKVLLSPDGRAAAFDLAADPSERLPLAVEHLATAPALLAALVAERARLASSASPSTPRAALDADVRERARVLGYSLPE